MTSEPLGDAPAGTADPLAMRASWIAAPGARSGAWLLRRDVDLGSLLVDEVTRDALTLLSAELVVATTGDVTVQLGDELLADVRSVGPGVATGTRIDLTAHLLEMRRSLVDHVSIGLRHVEDGSTTGGAPASVIGALVLHVALPAGSWTDEEQRVAVVPTDSTWWSSPEPVSFVPRDEPGRRPLEVHEVADTWTDDEGDELDWMRFGVMHTDDSRAWSPATDLGGHPSLVHPEILYPPPLVEEELVVVRDHVLATGGVQCFDLGGPVRSRPLLALPEGARRAITLWSGPTPGTSPRGGDVQVTTHGRATTLEAHGTSAGRWLHVHGAPDLELGDFALPVRRGVLPRPIALDLPDDLLVQLLSDGLTTLGMLSQEHYVGTDEVPLLADIARTARTALLVGHDTWRSGRALEEFVATAHEATDGAEGVVVDAIAPGDLHADLDEHTFALPGWVREHRDAAAPPRGAEHVAQGVLARIVARTRHGATPADRISTLAAALDALGPSERLDPEREDHRVIAQARDALVRCGRERLRVRPGQGRRAAWLETRDDTETSARATALALLSGLVRPAELAGTVHVLRGGLEEPDEQGLVRAALVRAGEGHLVVAGHEPGTAIPPVVTGELVRAISGIRIEGDRIHVHVPIQPLETLDLVLPHRRGAIHLVWDGTTGTAESPEGTHLLVHPEGASEPMWYNSGTAPLTRPAPAVRAR